MRSIKQFVIRLTLAVLLTVSGFAATGAPFSGQIFQGISDPRSLPSLAAWYDVSDTSTMLQAYNTPATNGNPVMLIADKSGNSSVNVLALNGVAGNYGLAADSDALSIVGDIQFVVDAMSSDWTPSEVKVFLARRPSGGTAAQSAYQFDLNTDGTVRIVASDGTTNLTFASTAPLPVSDLDRISILATLDVDNGAGGKTATFYTGPSIVGPWTQLGSAVTTAGVIAINDPAATALGIGSINNGLGNMFTGLIYRAQIYNGIAGTLAFDANFSTFSKLAATGTESSANAATVTINSTGATGARICGARDLYQGTVANQPVLTIAATGNYLTNDGSNDYLKSPAFALAQPETVYFVGSQVTWTADEFIYDGAAGAGYMALQQKTAGASPQIFNYAGANGPTVSTLAVATQGIVTSVFNSASSLTRVNRLTAQTGDFGTRNGNGFVLGARGDGATGWSNITVSEILIRNAADATSTQDAIILYLGRKWSIALP